MFIANDNLKIIKILKKLFLIYNRTLFRKKFIYFQKFQLNIIILKQYQFQKFGFNVNKENIYNKLFNELKTKEEHLNKLSRKINEEEEKLYSFTPKINKGRIIFNPIQNYQNNVVRNSMVKYSKSFFKNEPNKKNSNASNYSNIDYLKNTSRNQLNYNKKKTNLTLSQMKPSHRNFLHIPKYTSSKNLTNKSFSENNKLRKSKNIKKSYINYLRDKKNYIFNKSQNKPFHSISIPENLSSLFSSRLHINNNKIKHNEKQYKTKKMKKAFFDNSSYSNYNEKGTNYITEKGSGIEHLSTINNELNNSKKKKDKQKKNSNEGFYPLRTGITPYIYSNSHKSTHFVSPKSSDRNNIITNRSNYFGTFSNYLENSRDDNKINERNIKRKITDGNLTGNKSNNFNNNHYNNKNKLVIQRNVVNEKIIFNNKLDNEKLSRKSSNSQITLQSISDSKLYDIANHYVNTDESLERFRFFNKLYQNKMGKIHFNSNFNKNNYGK